MAPLMEQSFSYSDIYVAPETIYHDNDKKEVMNIHDLNERRRVVSFDETQTTTYNIIHRTSLSHQEQKATWYNGYELQVMKSLSRNEGRMVEIGLLTETIWSNHNGTEDEFTTIRGLEHKTLPGLQTKRDNRKNAWSAVFLEIGYQDIEEVTNDSAIAEEYQRFSTPCQETAHTIAQQDARDVRTMWNTNNNDDDEQQTRSININTQDSSFDSTMCRNKIPAMKTNYELGTSPLTTIFAW